MTVSTFEALAEVLDPNQPATMLDRDSEMMLSRLRKHLRLKLRRNRMLERRYDATQSTRHMDISVPPQLPHVEVVSGWGGKVVDSLEHRIDFRGWISTDDDMMGLDEIYSDNYMGIESSRAHVDSILYGASFVALGTGDKENDEPNVLITAESSLRSTMLWDYRARRAMCGYTSTYDENNKLINETLYTRNVTWTMVRNPQTGKVEVKRHDAHGLNRVPMVRLINCDRASNPHGRSEITPAIRYYTDAAVRTLLGMEVNREFYTVPMTFALNVRPETFGVKQNMSSEEKARLGWKIMMGHINIVPPNEENLPPADIKQLQPHPPTPYIEQVKMYAVLVAGESDLPVSYFGFPSDIPPSADSIAQAEYPLVRKAERRISSFNHSWRELAYLALLWRDGTAPSADAFRAIRCSFGDPSTPTRSARADEAQKLTASAILIPDSSVTYDRVGLTLEEQTQLEKDKRKAAARALAMAIATGQPQPAAPGATQPTVGPVQRNGNAAVPAGSPSPNNVQRGRQIAIRAGQV